MKLKIFIFLGIILFFHIGCGKKLNKTYNYTPYDEIKVEINLRKLKAHPKHKSVFLYFTFAVENSSAKNVYFNCGNIKAQLNEHINEFTYYDSLASVEPKTEELKRGNSIYNLYFVFAEEVGTKEIQNFEIQDFGITFDVKRIE